MIPPRWRQIFDKLYEAMPLDRERRASFLEQVGDSDPEMPQEIESLALTAQVAEPKCDPVFLISQSTHQLRPSHSGLLLALQAACGIEKAHDRKQDERR